MTFSILFTTSSGVLKGQVFAYPEERENYYQDQYDKNSFYGTNRGSDDLSFPDQTPGIIKGIFEGVDKEQLKEIEDKLFEGVDKERLLNNAINLLNEHDFDLGSLNEYLLDNSLVFGGSFLLIFVLFVLLVIIGAGFGLG
ncbi:MAG: hypothetical protein R3321_07605 [Nitrososphaeraceae archaeon]|nr:hypothetical protein [Nitrososphaeraceae archaeon]